MKDNPDNKVSLIEHKFIIFVSGMSVKSTNAIENLRSICNDYFMDNYDIQIVDISRDKAQALNYQLIGIPTLIRTSPMPPKMIVGDLSDKQRVLHILGVKL